MLEGRLPLFRREAHKLMDTLLAQRRMSSQSHHEIQLPCLAQHLHEGTEQKRQRQRTRVIGDQNQQALVRELTIQHAQRITHLVVRKKSPDWGRYLRLHHKSSVSVRESVTKSVHTVSVPVRDSVIKSVSYTPLNAENPPSMGITVPVTNAEAGETSQNTAPNKSSGFPKRFIGVCAKIDWPREVKLPSSFNSSRRFCSPTKKPGAIALTRICGE